MTAIVHKFPRNPTIPTIKKITVKIKRIGVKASVADLNILYVEEICTLEQLTLQYVLFEVHL